MGQNPLMTALAEKLDARFQEMDAHSLELVEQAVLGLLDAFEQSQTGEAVPGRTGYRLPPFPLAIRPGINPNKLGQLDDDL